MRKIFRTLVVFIMAITLINLSGGAFAAIDTKKALVVVSFGTTFKETRQNDIEGIENALKKAFPDRDFRRAFTSNIIRERMLKNQQIKVDDLATTLANLQKEGYQDVLIQPTHLIHGEEYEMKVMGTVEKYKKSFDKIVLGKPLMATANDYEQVVKGLKNQFPKLEKNQAVVFMGHGSPRDNNKSFGNTYKNLQVAFDKAGLAVVIGVVEEVDYPNFEDMYKMFKERGYKSAILMPLMVVSGDHANNDMSGNEEDSWKSRMVKDGYGVTAQMGGMGRNPAIQSMYVNHAKEALGK